MSNEPNNPNQNLSQPEIHLWEAVHPYYCNEGNYYSNDCGSHHKSWAEFIAEEGDANLDYNLVFRFDWREGEDWGAGEFTGDVNYRNGHLLIFFIGQRKGIYRYAKIEVCRADEPQVIEYLRPRYEYMLNIWRPFSSSPTAPIVVVNEK